MSTTPLIIGHRGSSAVAPENTLAAFARAITDGADGIEFDVRLSRDHIPVVIHDGTLRRTGLVRGEVAKMAAAELTQVDVGSWFQQGGPIAKPSYAGEKLPTLIQVFNFFRAKSGLLYLEMKCVRKEEARLAAVVVDLIRQNSMLKRVIVESFNLAALAEIKRLDASILTAALFEPKRRRRPVGRSGNLVQLARRCGAVEIALNRALARPRLIEEAKRSGLEVVVWTVDDPEWIPRSRLWGVKALITNDPATMLGHRDGRS